MKSYIGSKQVHAYPMNRLAYVEYRGWKLPADECGEDEGYLVEYTDGGKPNHNAHNGYISWSPKEQFDAAYRPTTGMSFGLAIEAAKAGSRIARAGWNGKGMWVAYTPGSTFPVAMAKEGHAAWHRAQEGGVEMVTLLPHLDMRTADGSMNIGWLASQTDMLADDWVVL